MISAGSIPSSQASLSTPSHYRPDIDGLRAIAVLLVVGYHAFPNFVPGGYIGVDIFFVISGYLITNIVFREMLAGRFSILAFYQRRIRRIFPALILVTAVSFIIGWFILPPKELQSLGSNIAGGAIFAQNIVLLGQVGYFDIAAAKKPLLHLWSLGIEEQYYIAWPLILLVVRWARVNATTLAIVLIVASFWLDLAILRKSVDLAFYLPFTRAWELLAGSAIALWLATFADVPVALWIVEICRRLAAPMGDGLQQLVWAPDARPSRSPVQQLIAIVAIAGLAYAVYHLTVRSPYPGVSTLVPVAAAGVFILTRGASFNRHVLSFRPMVFVGLISYPLYLWHFPLMAFARIMSETEPAPLTMATIVVASFVLAWLTYRYVERPLRFAKKFGRVQVVGLLSAMVLVGAIGLITVESHGFPTRIPEEVRPFMLTGEETAANWRRGQCLLLPDQGASDFVDECSGDGKRPLLFLWGDSYAAALYAGLNVLSAKYEFGVAEYTASACPPLLNFDHPDRRFCKTINDYVLKKVAELHPEVVILHSTWSYSEGILESGLQDTVSSLKALNIKRIVLLGPVSSWMGNGLAANVLDYYMHGAFSVIPARTKYRSNDEWTVALGKWLELRATRLGIEYVSARDIMCNSDGCLARIGENGASLTAFDNGHLTLPGAEFVAGALLKDFLK